MYNDFVVSPINQLLINLKVKISNKASSYQKRWHQILLTWRQNQAQTIKKKAFWKKIAGEVPEKDSWYMQTGQGMLATINAAAEQKGVTFTDRGTYIKYEANQKGHPEMVIINEGDNDLKKLLLSNRSKSKTLPKN